MVGLLFAFPLLGHLFLGDVRNIVLSKFSLISIYKGITLFYLIKYQQVVNKENTSSSVFLTFIALAIGALANNLFFNEGLGIFKLCSILSLGILGFVFLSKVMLLFYQEKQSWHLSLQLLSWHHILFRII